MLGVPVTVAISALLLCLAVSGAAVLVDDDSGSDGPSVTKPSRSAPPLRAEPSQPNEDQPNEDQPRADQHAAPMVADGRPRRSLLTIPAIDVRSLVVLPYRGSPDDGPGTRIQNGGVAASPFGPRGGVGPGGIGNYILTAHRTSSTRAFADLPSLAVGDRVHVVAGKWRYVYRITQTRSTSFRSASSLARQSAAVPGHPGRRPTQAMITLSTCATPEDHARGNYWADQFGNPEHRIDKVGTLIATRPA